MWYVTRNRRATAYPEILQSFAMIPGARLAVVKGAPHGLTATHGAELNALMLEFLA
jgi:pimeloyl-ACP methyl ester carboxylesterase